MLLAFVGCCLVPHTGFWSHSDIADISQCNTDVLTELTLPALTVRRSLTGGRDFRDLRAVLMHRPVSKKMTRKRVRQRTFREDSTAKCRDRDQSPQRRAVSLAGCCHFPGARRVLFRRGTFPMDVVEKEVRCQVPQSKFRGHHDGGIAPDFLLRAEEANDHQLEDGDEYGIVEDERCADDGPFQERFLSQDLCSLRVPSSSRLTGAFL